MTGFCYQSLRTAFGLFDLVCLVVKKFLNVAVEGAVFLFVLSLHFFCFGLFFRFGCVSGGRDFVLSVVFRYAQGPGLLYR